MKTTDGDTFPNGGGYVVCRGWGSRVSLLSSTLVATNNPGKLRRAERASELYGLGGGGCFGGCVCGGGSGGC